jgi:hypothetical protein
MSVRRAVALKAFRVVKAAVRNDEVFHAGSEPKKGLPQEAFSIKLWD